MSAGAQPTPVTQCVSTAVAGGTGDAITIPMLPCVPTTTQLILTITATNTTTVPTIKVTGGGATQPIVQNGGGPLTVGQLAMGSRYILVNDGFKWILLNSISSPATSDESANTVYAGPPSGAPALPTFRSLTLADLPNEVANTTALRNASTAMYPSGLFRITDGAAGAPPLYFNPSSSVCSTDDGAGCVNSADGKSWLPVFPAEGADIRQWGVVIDNTTDDTATMQKALQWAGTHSGKLILPSGSIYMAGTATATISAGGSLTIEGAGSRLSSVRAAAGASPFNLVLADQNGSFHIGKFSCLASGTTTAICLTITQAQALVNNPIGPTSEISDMEILGSDGYEHTNGFTTDIKLVGVSNVNVWGGTFSGQGYPALGGTAVDLEGDANHLAVVFNFHGTNIFNVSDGILVGKYVQGVVFDGGGNCVVAVHCIDVPNTSTPQTEQVTVVNSQFNCFVSGCSALFVNVPTPGVFFNSNLCLVYPSTTCVNLEITQGAVINDNQIVGIPPTPGGSAGTGINVASTFAFGPTVIGSGNSMTNLQSAITLGSTADVVSIQSPKFIENVSNLTNANITTRNDSIKGAAIINSATSVMNATDNGSGFVRLTIGDTSEFVSGEQVLVSGVGGLVTVNSAVISVINVVNSTQMDLIFITFSGSYTGGGAIFNLP